ncbi:hypothetical protein OEV98_12845 [Caldibacillus lycopersici]|uniref:Uncharacterized protein n=1 Tax=Perspicuibacillus lycopersici TaxID=1325689 RepID=A0AAE3LN89_9BACI|nr:hypothetical protein [Perspicuibacillus lycopersici]MCU9614425.1 hypothetical protein [Perspicuibacillus lycopersici]
MITIKVKTNGKKFFVPIPYGLLNLGINILSSDFITKQLNKAVKGNGEDKKSTFTMPPLEKENLKKVVKELKKYRGYEIVKIKDKDGTEIFIKL